MRLSVPDEPVPGVTCIQCGPHDCPEDWAVVERCHRCAFPRKFDVLSAQAVEDPNFVMPDSGYAS